jgi:hypothetical protein
MQGIRPGRGAITIARMLGSGDICAHEDRVRDAQVARPFGIVRGDRCLLCAECVDARGNAGMRHHSE